jgi:hypothetical protein
MRVLVSLALVMKSKEHLCAGSNRALHFTSLNLRRDIHMSASATVRACSVMRAFSEIRLSMYARTEVMVQ